MQNSTPPTQESIGPAAIVEIAAYRTADGVKTVTLATNPFETEDAFSAAADIEDKDIDETVVEYFDLSRLEGQNYADVNKSWLARLTVTDVIEAAEFNADLLAAAVDLEAIDVPVEVV